MGQSRLLAKRVLWAQSASQRKGCAQPHRPETAMCLLLFAYRCHREYPLLLIANRDEFYTRPTAPAAPWKESGLVAGRDLQAGGTWVGMLRGRVAAVTNIREPGTAEPDQALTRGEIPLDFLTGNSSPEQFAENLQGPRYRGFNALLFDLSASQPLACAGNRHAPFLFTPGIHGISNGAPDAPWPKVEKGKARLECIVQSIKGPLSEENFVKPALEALQDRQRAADTELPHTGIGLPLERALSPIFVQIDSRKDFMPVNVATSDTEGGYGTRASTIIAINRNGFSHFWEQTFERGKLQGPLRHFSLPSL
ncbi:NRDE family protein [Microbulbifer epialgicus]|uniref:NRDE family protein n=1 Tax=Microbulbifer epialgicus TaxID=393907 RepID=A0ABV4NV58_9GAMM